jgi:hypothetical protein
VFRAGDIATVTHGYVDPDLPRAPGSLRSASRGDDKGQHPRVGKQVEKATADFMKAVPQGIEV